MERPPRARRQRVALQLLALALYPAAYALVLLPWSSENRWVYTPFADFVLTAIAGYGLGTLLLAARIRRTAVPRVVQFAVLALPLSFWLMVTGAWIAAWLPEGGLRATNSAPYLAWHLIGAVAATLVSARLRLSGPRAR